MRGFVRVRPAGLAAAAAVVVLALSPAGAPAAAAAPAAESPTPTHWVSPGEGSTGTPKPEAITGTSSSIQLRRGPLVLIDERRKGRTTSLTLSSDVLFASDSDRLGASSAATLDEVVKRIKAAGASGPVRVVGYTDTDGSRAHNQDLSTRRAGSVADYLRPRLDDTGTTLRPSGRGERDLAVRPERSAADKARNRRVTVTYRTATAGGTAADTDVSVGPDTTAEKASGPLPAGTAAAVRATTTSTYSGRSELQLDVTAVQRQGPFVYVGMRLQVLSVGSGTSYNEVSTLFSGDRYESDPSRTVLYDRPGHAALQVVITGKGGQLRSGLPSSIEEGHSANLWFYLTGPEQARDRLDLYVPAFGVVRNLQVKGA